jgi:hypothetical protein
MHIAIATGGFALAFAVIPKGRSVIGAAWSWLTQLLRRYKSEAPCRYLLRVRVRWNSKRGNGIEAEYLREKKAPTSSGDGGPLSQKLLDKCPPAIGSELPSAPNSPARPNDIPLLPLPPAPIQNADSSTCASEKANRVTKRAQNKRRSRPRRG